MPPNVTGNLSAASGVTHVDCVLQVKLFGKHREIVGVGVHVIAVPGLCGTAVPSPIVRDDPITTLAEEQHLSVPVVCGERPAVTEHDGLALSPVLVVNLRTVFGGNGGHNGLLLVICFTTATCTGKTGNAFDEGGRECKCKRTTPLVWPYRIRSTVAAAKVSGLERARLRCTNLSLNIRRARHPRGPHASALLSHPRPRLLLRRPLHRPRRRSLPKLARRRSLNRRRRCRIIPASLPTARRNLIAVPRMKTPSRPRSGPCAVALAWSSASRRWSSCERPSLSRPVASGPASSFSLRIFS